jgi:energy-converting hydrogenase Eha subunit E
VNEASFFGSIVGALAPVWGILQGAALIALPLVGTAIGGAIKDSHKRELIREVAQGAVAAAMLRFPNSTAPQMVQEVVDSILQQPNPPTTNKDALTRAVTSALAVQKQANNVATAAGHPGA